MFNEDVEAKGVPASVERVKNQLKGCQAILFGVSENNSSVSACLKNAYDWLSRGELLKNIPAAMVSSGGQAGALGGHTALKAIGQYLNVQFLSYSPEIAVKRYAGQFFSEAGDVTSE